MSGGNGFAELSGEVGAVARRRKWTRQDNEDVVTCYLLATERGQPKIGYGRRMLEEWASRRPDRVLTVVQLTNQFHFIKRAEKISDSDIDDLRQRLQAEGLLPDRGVLDDADAVSACTSAVLAGSVPENGAFASPGAGAEENAARPRDAPGGGVASSDDTAPVCTPSLVSIPGERAGGSTGTPQSLESTIDARADDGDGGVDHVDGRSRSTESESEEDVELTNTLMAAFRHWRNEDICDRPELPSLRNIPRRRLRALTTRVNHIIRGILHRWPTDLDLEDLNCLVFAAAHTISFALVPARSGDADVSTKRKCEEPAWLQRLQKKLEITRADLARLRNMKDRPSPRHSKLWRRYALASDEDLVVRLEEKRLLVLALAERLRRYRQNLACKRANALFRRSERAFYRQLRSDNTPTHPVLETQLPTQDQVEDFWGGLWSTPAVFNQGAWYRRQCEEFGQELEHQENPVASLEQVKNRLRRLPLWRAPGPDRIQGFWWKSLSMLHEPLTLAIGSLLNSDADVRIPEWLVTGRTVLLPKTPLPSADPRDYRPITCLPVLYKIITAVVSDLMWPHISQFGILPVDQRGCVPGSLGCKEQLLLNQMVVETARRRKRNLSMCWIDFKKAYDSVSHEWILAMLWMYRFHPSLVRFIERCMILWQTRLCLRVADEQLTTAPVHIRRGIFQGDTLSPLLFCLAIAPISTELDRLAVGFHLRYGDVECHLSHLMYMDDIKLYTNSPSRLQSMVTVVEQVAGDVGLEFGLRKCAVLHLQRGLVRSGADPIVADAGTPLSELADDDLYKYLGVREAAAVAHADVKASLCTEYRARLRRLLSAGLCASNLSRAFNSFAVPVLLYSFGVLHWRRDELAKLDTHFRTEMTKHCLHHPRAAVQRMYLPRAGGGRGFLCLSEMHDRAVAGIYNYLQRMAPTIPRLAVLLQYHEQKHIYSVARLARKFLPEVGIESVLPPGQFRAALKRGCANHRMAQLQAKPLHGMYWSRSAAAGLSSELSFLWLRNGSLPLATEGLIIAAQDQALATRNYLNVMARSRGVAEGPSQCRLCHNALETVDHIVSACSALAATSYVERHNRVVCAVHHAICRELAPDDTPQSLGRHRLVSVREGRHGNVKWKLLWEFSIPTAASVGSNRPDLVLVKGESVFVIDISVPLETNVSTKLNEKIVKYQRLREEILRMWEVKRVTVVPVIVGALGGLTKECPTHLSRICTLNVGVVQRVALLGTAKILRSFLHL